MDPQKIDKFIIAFLKGNKEQIASIVDQLNPAEMKTIAIALSYSFKVPIKLPDAAEKKESGAAKKHSRKNIFDEDWDVRFSYFSEKDQDPIDGQEASEEEQRERIKRYAKRAEMLKSDYLKINSVEELFCLIQKSMEKEGWKFWDEQ